MEDLFSFAHPLWLWLAAGALLLIGEVVTGTSWLLWPAVSAALVGLLSALGVTSSLGEQLAMFAVLSVASTFASQGLIRRRRRGDADGADINDSAARLPGRTGEAVGAFTSGRGRVLVDGAEWRAELEGDDDLPAGAEIEIVERLDGARLKVRAR